MLAIFIVFGFILPKANAGVFSFVETVLPSTATQTASASNSASTQNSQNAPVLQAENVASMGSSTAEVQTDNGALVTEIGPLGTTADNVYIPDSETISLYTVRSGDTLAIIAKIFKVSTNTIIWANDLKQGTSLKEGQILVILPISGIRYEIKKGDTIKGIAKKTGGDTNDILYFNNIATDEDLKIGGVIIVPNGELIIATSSAKKPTKEHTFGANGPSYDGYYIRPIVGGKKSQGIHGFNSVDLAAPKGTIISAAADGVVIVARSGGYGGGYGSYVVISHSNGTQTLYAHMNKVIVSVGNFVSQGDTIGFVGSTGKSTGNHVHFEIRGAKNPF